MWAQVRPEVFHGQDHPSNGRRNTLSTIPDAQGSNNDGNDLPEDSPSLHLVQVANNSPPTPPDPRLDTTELDALAAASMVQARQEGLTSGWTPNAALQRTQGFVDPGLSATPRGLGGSIAEFPAANPVFTSGNDETLPSSAIGKPFSTLFIFDMYNNIFNSIDFTNFSADGSFPATVMSTFGSSSERASSIPLERFALVSRLWPNNKSRIADDHTANFWTEVINFKGDNILTDISISETSPAPSINRENEFQWGLDEDKRRDLILEFAPDVSENESAARFPPLRLLNLGLDVVFRQAHSLLPFIHQPTFSAKSAPNSVVLPLCLLGLLLLDSKQARGLALSYLPGVTRKCCQQLGVTSFGRGSWVKLVARLMSGTVLLLAWTICPARDHQNEMLTRMLYTQVISLANVSGLFAKQPPSTSIEDIQARLQGQGDPHSSSHTDDAPWKAWARAESLKSLGETPLLRADKIHFEHPSAPELFQASSARVWRRLTTSSFSTNMMQTQEGPLADTQNMSPVGIVGLLSTIWIRILEIRPHRKMQQLADPGLSNEVFRVLAQEDAGRGVSRMLNDVYISYARILRFKNPNCIAMWHFLNLNLFADLETFDLAAGRNGADDAHEALQRIAAWSQTWQARRACLHAAGIHASMNRRRIKDGTMLHSELSIFSAALVLGLYVFMMASSRDDPASPANLGPDPEPYELLNDVDWPDLSGAGSATSLSPVFNADESQESAARRFVREGGVVSFSGVICDGGYNAAKMILLEYASLLEEVGKWDATGLCRILRIMSDSLLDIDDQMDTG
ncbi:hypothetical protein F5X68DRAFT_246060 [Plectosphaerella plurivora]|uniref:Transcription factor domain-containing protein n=1 Tax=Plectosphaerella plurivora TaxID=936078 RepID=A0A9P9A7N9_9PEZI|nr:hypothetical protein F5X68DRAFT_246060 [Plectosphaerella plurivora]